MKARACSQVSSLCSAGVHSDFHAQCSQAAGGVQEGTDPHGSSQLLTAPHGFWGLPGAAGGTSPCLSLLSSASTQRPAARPHFLSPFQNHHGDVKAQITARMLWLVGSAVSATGWGAGGGPGVPGAGAVLPRPFPARAGTARCVAASK